MSYDGFVSHSSPGLQEQVTMLVDVAEEEHGIKLWKENMFTHDGFLSYSWAGTIKDRVTKLAEVSEKKHGIKLWQDRNEVGHGGIFDQMGNGIRNSEFFLPVITKDYVEKVDGNRIKMKDGKVTENCRFEANMGMIHRGEPRTIPIIMEADMEDKKKWGNILGGNLGDLLYVSCFTDNDVEKAADLLAWQMENAKKAKTANKDFYIFNSIDVKQMHIVPKDKASEYVEGTRLWIYDHMQNEWLNQKSWSQVFVLLGYAGVGKSVCMANVCERGHLFEPALVYDMLSVKKEASAWKRMSQSIGNRLSLPRKKKGNTDFIVVACHFFKHDDSRLRSAKNCLLSLAAQMYETIPHFSEYCTRHNKNLDVNAIDVKELFKRLIAEPLKAMQDGKHVPPETIRAFVVLDALDECRAEDRKGLLDILQTTWWETVPKWLGVCVSSRPEDYIPPKLKEYKPTILDTESEANMNDMRVYLNHKLRKYFVDNENELKASVDVVLVRSEGHFLYARFIESELSRVEKLTLKDVQGAKLFPSKLDGYYEEYFQRLFDKVGEARYQRLLASMCVAREPLPIDAVGKLLNFKDEVQDLFDDISQLLVVNDQTVRFVHKSMADFLTDREKCTDKTLRVREKDGNLAMAKYCRENFLVSMFAAKHLVYHLRNDDQTVISELLCDLQMLHQVLVVLGVNHRSFVGDLNRFYHADNIPAQLVIRALEKSFNVLDEERRELASQLFGRIDDRDHPVLKTTLDVNYSYLRPVNLCLLHADDPLRMILHGHGSVVRSVVANHRVIVSGSDDCTIKVWSQATGECLKTLKGHSNRVSSVAIGGDMIVSGSSDKTVKVWSLKSGECLKTLKGHSSVVTSVSICDDVIVSESKDEINVWSFESGECLNTWEDSDLTAIGICHDVMVCRDSFTVEVWSLKSGECLKTLEGHSQIVTSVAICDDVIVGGGSCDVTVKVWSLKSGECLKTLKGHSGWVNSVAICGDMIVSGSDDTTVKVWSLKSGECLKTLEGHSDFIRSVAICDDVIVSGSRDNTVKVWSLQNGECLMTLEGYSHYVPSVAIGDDLIVRGSSDNTVMVWNLKRGGCFKILGGHSKEVTSVVFCNDVIVSGSKDKTVKVWSLKNGECLKTLEGHSGWVNSVAICDDVIVSGSYDKTVKVWSLTSGECLKTLEGHSNYVYSVAICDDVIVSGSKDKTVKIWSLQSGECLKTLEGHSFEVLSVALYEDIIISMSWIEKIRWSRSSLNRLDHDLSNMKDTVPSSLWIVDGDRVCHPDAEVGFTMDATFESWEASETHIVCFDQRNVPNILEIVKS